MTRRQIALFTCSLCLLCGTSAWAQGDSRVYIAGGADLWAAAEPHGHGYALAAWQLDDLWRELDVELLYNTDTVQLSARGLELGDSLKLGAFFANLMMDYYQRGERIEERGLRASYLQGGVALSNVSSGPVFIDLELSTRRWFFGELDETDPALELPPSMLTVEARLRLTVWQFEHDAAFSDPHRHRWRLRGWGGGANLGADFRSNWRPWGARDQERFDPVDLRNLRGKAPLLARVWLAGGWQALERLRLQGRLFLSAGIEEDDLTRTRVGGLNPYVVQVPGLPWAALVPQNFGAAQGTVHVLAFGQTEIGLQGNVVTMSRDDALRVEEDRPGVLVISDDDPFARQFWGVGVFADMRFGKAQVDATLGWAPQVDALDAGPYLSGWLSAGWEF